MSLVRPLPAGPLDVVGDVHGEHGALRALLTRLGYAPDGRHPDGRHLVFVGDLVDRGEDSLAVLRLARAWCDAGLASCVLGNHELNLLLGKRRSGNEWFHGAPQFLAEGGGLIEQRVLGSDAERDEVLEFIETLPLALERPDLRVVHACWDEPSIAVLRAAGRGSAREQFHAAQVQIESGIAARGLPSETIEADLERQNGNPVAVCTSGLERRAAAAFRAGGRMRRVERVAWWESYADSAHVAFGHYWRGLDPGHHPAHRGPDLFAGLAPQRPLGPAGAAHCLDYSVGMRNAARARGGIQTRRNALAALRWPEREIVTDLGLAWRVD